jgi:hypothetical protein
MTITNDIFASVPAIAFADLIFGSGDKKKNLQTFFWKHRAATG